jgi:Family of unknown function (DUF6406)
MSDRVTIPETGQVTIDGVPVMAASIWEREPLGRDGAHALHVELTLGEEQGVDLARGEEIEIAGASWRVEEIVEDPEHRRGSVVLARR